MRPTRSAIALTLLLSACRAAPLPVVTTAGAPVQVPTGPVALRVAPKGETAPVEVGGIPPNDTVVVVRRGFGRTVILRHGPPDRTDFAELTLPATVFATAPAESVLVTIRMRPGVYGIELSADAPWGPGTELAFKYAIHFYPPADALRRFGTLTEVDRRLTLARRERNGDLTIYLSSHPAPDVVKAFIPGEGTYVMVVGK
jgi:acetamidase/formamidase